MSLARELDSARFRETWARVRRPGGAGADGVDAQGFARGLDQRLASLRAAVLSRRYRPGRLLHRSKRKPDGSERLLSIPTLSDRIVQAAVLPSAIARAERVLLPGVHGFRPRRSTATALAHLCRRTGRVAHLELVVVDIADMFDRLPRALVLDAARAAWPDPLWTWLVERYLAAWSPRGRGVPQGAPLSPLMANLALHLALDRFLAGRASAVPLRAWIRYGDDIALVSEKVGGAVRLVEFVRDRLGVHALRLSDRKVRLAVAQHPGPLRFALLGHALSVVRRDGLWQLHAVAHLAPWSGHLVTLRHPLFNPGDLPWHTS